MSRIGSKKITIPAGVKVVEENGTAVVTGKLGTLRIPIPSQIAMKVEDSTITFERKDDTTQTNALHGLTRSIAVKMYQQHGIIMTVGVYAVATGENKRTELQNAVVRALTQHKDIVQVHGFYYFEKENLVTVDVVPDLSVRDEQTFCRQLIAELQPLLPDVELSIVIDHNYSE